VRLGLKNGLAAPARLKYWRGQKLGASACYMSHRFAQKAAMVCAGVRHDKISCTVGGKEREAMHFTAFKNQCPSLTLLSANNCFFWCQMDDKLELFCSVLTFTAPASVCILLQCPVKSDLRHLKCAEHRMHN